MELHQVATSHPVGSRQRLTLFAFLFVTALIVLGQVIFLVRAGSGAMGASVSPALHGTPPQRLKQVVAGALGGSDRHTRRFTMTVHGTATGEYTVGVTWAINSNLSQGTIGNGAELDVYNLMRGLFDSGIAVGLARLTGTYPLSITPTATREMTVMRLSMNRQEAAFVARTGWNVLDPQTVWPLVERHYVNADFRPISSD